MATTSTQIPTEDNFVLWIDCVFNKCNTSGDLTLRIVDSDESQALNAQYRQKDYATNVLSFPADLPPDLELNLLGDLVICAPVVMAEAAQQHKTLNAHWAHMVVHGTLHLLGYDHETDEDAHIMETLETELLTSLGFPAPYEIL